MSRDIMCMLRVCSQIIFNLVHLIQHKFFSSYETDVLCSFSAVGRHAHQAAKAWALFCQVRALRVRCLPEIMLQ